MGRRRQWRPGEGREERQGDQDQGDSQHPTAIRSAAAVIRHDGATDGRGRDGDSSCSSVASDTLRIPVSRFSSACTCAYPHPVDRTSSRRDVGILVPGRALRSRRVIDAIGPADGPNPCAGTPSAGTTT